MCSIVGGIMALGLLVFCCCGAWGMHESRWRRGRGYGYGWSTYAPPRAAPAAPVVVQAAQVEAGGAKEQATGCTELKGASTELTVLPAAPPARNVAAAGSGSGPQPVKVPTPAALSTTKPAKVGSAYSPSARLPASDCVPVSNSRQCDLPPPWTPSHCMPTPEPLNTGDGGGGGGCSSSSD